MAEKTFATVHWNAADITDHFAITEAEAETFLARHATAIQAVSIEAAVELIESLAEKEGLPSRYAEAEKMPPPSISPG